MESLQKSYTIVLEQAKGASAWYMSNIKTKRKWSKRIRFWSILLFSLGGLVPLINAIILENKGDWQILNLGYIAIALAGTLLLFDRFFGLSSGWIRYITTEMEISKKIKEFELRWKIETYGKDLDNVPTEEAKELLRVLLDFMNLIEGIVKEETSAWSTDFQSSMAELQKSINNKVETIIPGNIKVSITNAKDFKKLKIRLDNLEIIDLKSPVHLFREISTGYHLVTVSGEDLTLSQVINAAEVANVEPGKMAEVSLSLGG